MMKGMSRDEGQFWKVNKQSDMPANTQTSKWLKDAGTWLEKNNSEYIYTEEGVSSFLCMAYLH